MGNVTQSSVAAAGQAPASWVLVTGGAVRLGRALCLAFADAGWNVLLHYRHSLDAAQQVQALVQARGRQCRLVQADLARPEAAGPLLADCRQALHGQPLRCIVNNASQFDADTAATAQADGLLAHLQTNTVTPLLLGNGLLAQAQQHGTPPPGGAGWFSVLHILDQKVHNLNPDYFSYTVSKLALERSVALQAQALAPWVRVCGISPGLMFLSGPQTQDNFDRASRVNLLQTPIDPVQVARSVVFAAENPALNGCTLPVDNGQHLLPLSRDVMFAVDESLP
ncbi:Dihydromonapterin reductase [uncultured Comamonas sp.]|nr:Dihydromonapterin reductase [uncultured Comamonas sp.]